MNPTITPTMAVNRPASSQIRNRRRLRRWHLNQAITFFHDCDETADRAERTFFSAAGYLESTHNPPTTPCIPRNRDFVCTIHEIGDEEHWVVTWFDLDERTVLVVDVLQENIPLNVFLQREVRREERHDAAVARLRDWLAGTAADFSRAWPPVRAVSCPTDRLSWLDWTSGIRCLDIVYNLLARPSARASDVLQSPAGLGDFSARATVSEWERRFLDIEAWDVMDPLFGRPEYGPGRWLVCGEWFTGEEREGFDGEV